MHTPPSDPIRERRFAAARRIAAHHERMLDRWPRSTRFFDALARRTLTACARCELPRTVGLMELAIVALPGAWPNAGTHESRGMWHGQRLMLDCSDYFQRFAHALGRYHEVPIQLLVRRALRPGDTFIDGGANIGLLSIIAAWCVGATGRVYAMEPNPAIFERLAWHASANRLSQLAPLPIGLSDRAEELVLRIPGTDNSGAATFAPVPERYRGVVRHHSVAHVTRADAMPNLNIRGELFVKLDVEGFELRALRGMASLIDTHRPLIVCEVNDEMLTMAGASRAEVFAFMAERGYRPFAFEARRTIVRLRRLVLRPIESADVQMPFDVLWMHPNGAHMKRLNRCIIPRCC